MTRIRIAFALAIITSLGLPPGVDAGVVEKPGFTLTLPDGWIEIPQEVLAKMQAELKRQAPKATIPKYDYGFQIQGRNWLAYPYILVQVNNAGRVAEAELKALPKIDLNQSISGDAENYKAIASNIVLGQPQYDEASRIVWLAANSDVVGIGKVQGLSGMILTNRGMLQIHGYAVGNDFAKYVSTFRQVVKTARLSPSLEYTAPSTAPAPGQFDWQTLGFEALSGAIAGGLATLVVAMLRRKKQTLDSDHCFQ